MGNLTPEQQAQIEYEDRTDDPLLTADELRRKKNREKKRASRGNLKAAAALAKQSKQDEKAKLEAEARYRVLDQIDNYGAFWDMQRASLSVEEKAKLEAVHDEMTEWTLVMDSYVNGTDGTDARDLADTILDVIELMKATDVAPSELIAIPRFWTKAQRSIFQQIAETNEAARVFANYGYLLGPLSYVYARFRQKFIQKQVEIEVPQYAVLECSVCQQIASRTNVLPAIAEAYKSLNIPYKCANCREQQSNHMNRVSEYNSAVKKPTIFDKFARLKDKDDD